MILNGPSWDHLLKYSSSLRSPDCQEKSFRLKGLLALIKDFAFSNKDLKDFLNPQLYQFLGGGSSLSIVKMARVLLVQNYYMH